MRGNNKCFLLQNKKKKYLAIILNNPSCLELDILILSDLTHFILKKPKRVLAKSADPDQMPHKVASDPGLHYFASCSAIFQQK